MFPLGDSTKDAGARRGGRAAGWRSPTSRTRTTSASSPTATPAASWPGASARSDGPIVDAAERRGARPALRIVRLHRRPAPRAEPHPAGARRRAALRAVDPARPTTPCSSGRASCSTPTRSPPAPAVWTSGAAPAADRFDCLVQLRAHGMTSPATVTVHGDEVRAELDRAAAPASRPGRRWSCTTATPCSARRPSPPPRDATACAVPRRVVDICGENRPRDRGRRNEPTLAGGRGHRHRFAARHRPAGGGRAGVRRAARPAAPARAARSRAGRGARRPRRGPARGPAGRDRAVRLAALRASRTRPAPGPRRSSPATSTRSRPPAAGYAGRGQGAGGRAVDARRERRAQHRAQDRRRPRRGPRSRGVAGRGAARGTSPMSRAGCPPRGSCCNSTNRRLPAVLAGAGADPVRATAPCVRSRPTTRSGRCATSSRSRRRAAGWCTAARTDVPLALLRAAGADAIALDAALLTPRPLRRARRGRRCRPLALARHAARHRRAVTLDTARDPILGSGPSSASRRRRSPRASCRRRPADSPARPRRTRAASCGCCATPGPLCSTNRTDAQQRQIKARE